MASNSKVVFGFLLLLVLLLTPQDEDEVWGSSKMTIVKVEARMCETQSHGFKGQCWSEHNCRLVCAHEGFRGGKCRGFRKRCFCTRPCH
ncbi:hypothetical protein ABFS82_08G160100 [Erythranthe guttata]|uniref:defensin-like protein 1 n=1 Tax=Erythranthe guttata TaxID=4155 RepID=UPI00064DF29A|nr:PREDICTED: defensin-like protein 1 [Erythranthe guttata]|eukprot:XP_012841887.1 PREDICTED: defensin-like protein 1 [Erythranthe guttata]